MATTEREHRSPSPATRPSPRRCARSTPTWSAPTPSPRRPRSCSSTRRWSPTARSTPSSSPSRVGALGHERRDRLGGRRRADHDGDLLPGLRPHVGGPLRRRELPAAHRHDHGEPRPLGPHQHPLRPQRHHGRPRHRLDPALRREPPGGLRQLHPGHPHRRAHGRAHCRSCTCTTATSSAAPSARCRCSPTSRCRSSSARTTPSTRMLDAKNPVTVGPFDGLHGWYFEHKVVAEPGHGPRPQGHPGRRRRVRRAQRPPVRPARPVPPRGRRDRHRRGRLHRRHDAHDRSTSCAPRASRPAWCACACSGPSRTRPTPRRSST